MRIRQCSGGAWRSAASAIVLACTMLGLANPGVAAQAPQLQDQRGHAFTLNSLRGIPLVVTFVSAHCTDACPLINSQFAMAQEAIAHQRLHVRLLTITLDPAHDTPATMRHLAHEFNANPQYWLLASGTVPSVRAIMAQFGVFAQRGRTGYADIHTTFVYFIDAHGQLRKTVLASTNLGTQLIVELHQNWRELTA